MVLSAWTISGNVVLDSLGNVIVCEDCPCGSCIVCENMSDVVCVSFGDLWMPLQLDTETDEYTIDEVVCYDFYYRVQMRLFCPQETPGTSGVPRLSVTATLHDINFNDLVLLVPYECDPFHTVIFSNLPFLSVYHIEDQGGECTPALPDDNSCPPFPVPPKMFQGLGAFNTIYGLYAPTSFYVAPSFPDMAGSFMLFMPPVYWRKDWRFANFSAVLTESGGVWTLNFPIAFYSPVTGYFSGTVVFTTRAGVVPYNFRMYLTSSDIPLYVFGSISFRQATTDDYFILDGRCTTPLVCSDVRYPETLTMTMHSACPLLNGIVLTLYGGIFPSSPTDGIDYASGYQLIYQSPDLTVESNIWFQARIRNWNINDTAGQAGEKVIDFDFAASASFNPAGQGGVYQSSYSCSPFAYESLLSHNLQIPTYPEFTHTIWNTCGFGIKVWFTVVGDPIP